MPLEDKDGAEADPSLTLGRQSGPWRWAGMLGRHALMVGEDPVATTTEDEKGRKHRVHVGNPVQSKFYNVATAASITGFVRAFLLRHIDKVEKAGGGVLYCDTDSIVCTDVDVAKTFALSNKLGDWAHEGRFDRGAIAGKKLYAFHGEDGKWKTATKGVRLKPEEICRVAEGEEVTWESNTHQFDLHRKLGPDGTMPPPRFLSRKVRMT